MQIEIVGAGVAGLACAEELTSLCRQQQLFDQRRGLGGHRSTRRIPTLADEAYFDHWSQYFTIRSDIFHRKVANWIS
jgi:renalase